MISCVIPAGANRPALLDRAVQTLKDGLLVAGVPCEILVEHDSPSCGAGWNTGAARASGEYVWLLSDDVELVDTAQLGWALEACDGGDLVCPAVFWPGGRLQGAGGYGLDLESGETAFNCIFPLMSIETWREACPVPALNHFCDVYLTSWARMRRRGPLVVRGLAVTHAIVSPDIVGEREAYEAWLANSST